MSKTVLTIVLIILLSTLFPLVGFYLDYRAKKRKYRRKSTPKNPQK